MSSFGITSIIPWGIPYYIYFKRRGVYGIMKSLHNGLCALPLSDIVNHFKLDTDPKKEYVFLCDSEFVPFFSDIAEDRAEVLEVNEELLRSSWSAAARKIVLCDDPAHRYVIASRRSAYKLLGNLLDIGIGRERIVMSKECKSGASNKNECYDVSLGYTRYDDLLGFHIHGKELLDKPHKTMLVLGGSTTDPTFNNINSWPFYLQKFLQDAGIPCVIYNGGMAGYKASQELIKLIRDGVYLYPDLVISYSGTNNAWAKHWVGKTKFSVKYQLAPLEYARNNGQLIDTVSGKQLKDIVCGIDNETSLARFWVDTERMMHAICAEFGINFYSFLQPVSGYTNDTNARSNQYDLPQDQFLERVAFYDEARAMIREHAYITDLSTIFEHRQYLFTDVCHLTERGNYLIAREVLKKVITELQTGA